jgi:hypothetical protein
MSPYEQPTGQPGQPVQGGQPLEQSAPTTQQGTPATTGQSGTARPQSIAEMSVSRPTLVWVSLTQPGEPLALGEDDYVLNSVYSAGTDAWEVLVLLRPNETAEETDTEE